MYVHDFNSPEQIRTKYRYMCIYLLPWRIRRESRAHIIATAQKRKFKVTLVISVVLLVTFGDLDVEIFRRAARSLGI